MACTNCTQTTASITGFVPANCTEPASCFLDAACVFYTGPALSCSAIATNDNLQSILQKIDPLLCAATGDYSTYNTYCLAPITTQKQFVESISNFVCTLRDDYDTFISTTYSSFTTNTNSRLVALEVPGITCASAGVINTDTLQQVLNKYCTKFGQIDSAIDPSTANWNQCYVVSPAPVTITAGFNAIISQICNLKGIVDANIGVPPTFNNTGSCLPDPLTAADSLVDTINKIKTRLCQTGVINTASLTFGCVSNTVSGATDLQGTIQNILTKVTQIAQTLPTQFDSGDFTVSNVDNSNLCLGKKIELAVPANPDRFVAATPSDTNPGTLQQKLIPGTNMSLDYITSPGFVVINSSAGVGIGDHKVSVDSTDPSPDYLGVKIITGGSVNGIQVIPTVDTVNHLILLNISVNPNVLFQTLIDTLSTDPVLKTNFCNAVATCPSPCQAPSNVTVTYQSGGTTTTTTTTSSTTTTTTTP